MSLVQTVATHATSALGRVDRERELARQNERMETFTSVVSHDLRSPLTAAAGHLELAREEYDSSSLDAVERTLERTTTLLDDVQAFAQAGAATLEPEPVALASVCETCWQHLETDGATLVTETDRTVRAHRSRLRQLVENLVWNAVEHGSTSRQTESDDLLTITVGDLESGFYVEDDGPGIPADDRARVFERGYSTSADGTGFGLAIVREVADIHGWDVRVTDGDAGGARFEVTGVELVEDESSDRPADRRRNDERDAPN